MAHRLSTSTKVGAIVAAHPGLSRVFESLDIDYCCGGNRPLGDACSDRQLDPDTVVAVLEAGMNAAPEEPDADSMGTRELIAHIVDTHHAFLREELPRVARLASTVAEAHGGEHESLHEVARICRELSGKLMVHLDEEEGVLFPAIGAGADAAVGRLVRSLEADHQETGWILARLRSLTEWYRTPDWGCNTYRALMESLEALEADVHRHVHKENNILFRRVRDVES